MAERNPMSARWAFTYNGAVPGQTVDQLGADVAYIVYQHEIAPQTGMRHIQGYVRFTTRKRFTTVTAWMAARGLGGAHISIARGSEKDNREYCTKEESRAGEGAAAELPVEHGVYDEEQGKQGARHDLQELTDMIDTGAAMREVAAKNPTDFVRYCRGLQSYMDTTRPKPALARDVTCVVLWGPTGTGKTHRVLTENPDVFDVKPGRDPWGSYRQEREVFFDEFAWGLWPITQMNRYLDKWRCLLDARYNDRYAEWTTVFICSNSNPASWYPDADPLLLDAFRRRIRGRCFYVDSQEPSLEQIKNSDPTPL